MGVARITLSGMMRAYEIDHGESIFNGITLPEGIDQNTLVDRIYYKCGEFYCMYADYNFLHDVILNFFKTHYRTFDKWQTALDIDYAPLENYDRQETYTGSGSNSGQDSSSGSGTSTLTKAAYNSSSYEPYEQNSDSNSISGSSSGSFTDSHTLRVHGNIGVTTSQQMLQSELDIARFNIIDQIADMLSGEITIMVY